MTKALVIVLILVAASFYAGWQFSNAAQKGSCDRKIFERMPSGTDAPEAHDWEAILSGAK